MKTSREFTDHCLDLFSGLGPVDARAMFGGHGFFVGGAMFAIGDAEEWKVWLKVDAETRARFEAAGGEPFTYSSKGRRETTLSFVTPPEDAMEDADAMLAWARLALESAERVLAKRNAKRQAASAKPTSKKPASAGRGLAPRRGRRRRAEGPAYGIFVQFALGRRVAVGCGRLPHVQGDPSPPRARSPHCAGPRGRA